MRSDEPSTVAPMTTVTPDTQRRRRNTAAESRFSRGTGSQSEWRTARPTPPITGPFHHRTPSRAGMGEGPAERRGPRGRLDGSVRLDRVLDVGSGLLRVPAGLLGLGL